MDKKTNLIWIDLEMTGLNFEKDLIIEIATIVTDSELNELACGPELAIKAPLKVIEGMGEWCQTQHAKSGLTERVLNSDISMAQAEAQTLEFLKQWSEPQTSPMCGNSICTDRRFLALQMPELEAYFHYRHVDVSTLKELAKRWAPDVAKAFEKDSDHRALSDIRDSINELKHYRQSLMTC